MALDTFANLKSSIADWLNRSDLTSVIPDFITLCEADLNRRLRVRRMVTKDSATVDAEYEALPTYFGGAINMRLTSTSPDAGLQYVSPERGLEIVAANGDTSGQPRFFSIVGSNFWFIPVPDAAYTCERLYWTRLTPLSDSATSNWVLADHPDAYLYGSLLQSAPYLKNDPRIAAWSALYEKAVNGINREDAYAAYSGAVNILPARSF